MASRSQPAAESAVAPRLGRRFDVQVQQSLPFMNFSNARWEMLLAVRNFFSDSVCDQSVYDELLRCSSAQAGRRRRDPALLGQSSAIGSGDEPGHSIQSPSSK